MRALTTSIVAIALATLSDPASSAALTSKDIQATFFNNQPFTAATPSKVKYKMIFSPDGKVTREPLGKAGVKGEGTWKFTKDGFCTSWKGSKANCFRVVPSGENKWSVMQGSTVMAIWTK